MAGETFDVEIAEELWYLPDEGTLSRALVTDRRTGAGAPGSIRTPVVVLKPGERWRMMRLS